MAAVTDVSCVEVAVVGVLDRPWLWLEVWMKPIFVPGGNMVVERGVRRLVGQLGGGF